MKMDFIKNMKDNFMTISLNTINYNDERGGGGVIKTYLGGKKLSDFMAH